MNIAVDENIPTRTVATLREMGHSVLDIRGTRDQGLDDSSLWQIAQRDSALLMTTDKGFFKNHRERHAGLLIIRLRQANRLRLHRRILHLFARYRAEDWPGLTVVARDRTVRIWRQR